MRLVIKYVLLGGGGGGDERPRRMLRNFVLVKGLGPTLHKHYKRRRGSINLNEMIAPIV